MAQDNIRFVKPNMEFVDGYFFTMDETRKSLIQKSDDGSTVFSYPCQIDPSIKVYFDNFDTNTYNPDYWTYGGTNGGFREGKFWSKRNSGASSGNILSSKFRAKGTYDIRIDYNLILLQSINWSGAQFQLVNYDVADTYLQVRRDYSSGHRYYADVKSGGAWTSVGNITTTDIVGGMRFYRAYNSTTTTVYYKSGVTGSWVGMGSTSTVGIGSSNNIQVKFFATSGSPYPEVEFEFDNFYMSIALSGVISLQYDGIYFWTLQKILGTDEPVIRKWLVRNCVCELIKEIMIINTSDNLYNSDAFAVEHYITELSDTTSSGGNTIHMDEYYDTVVTSGSILSIGNNGDDNLEDVVVSNVVGNDVILDSGLLYDHSDGTKIITSPSLFLFNNYTGTSSTNGSLIQLDASTGDFITMDYTSEYKNVTAATFARVQSLLRNYSDASTVIFIKNTEARFINMINLLDLIDASSANDSFTGNNYSLPDTYKWSIISGNPTIYNNALLCETSVGGLDAIKSNYFIMGDFDVQVSGTFGEISLVSGSLGYMDHYMQISSSGSSYKVGVSYKEYTSTIFADDFSAGGGNWTVLKGSASFVSGALKQTSDDCQVRTTSSFTYGTDWKFTFRFKHYGGGNLNDQHHINLVWVDANNKVTVRMRVYSSGSNDVLFLKKIGGSETNLFSSTKYNYYTYRGSWFWVTVERAGNATYFKIWLDGTSEPASWDYSSSSAASNFPTSGYIMANSMWTESNGSWLDDVGLYTSVIKDTNKTYVYTEINGTKSYHNLIAENTILEEANYMFRLNRVNDTLYFSHRTTTTGTLPSDWELLTNTSFNLDISNLVLGLSTNVTTSGFYFDDLEYTSGNIKYVSTTIPYYGIMNIDNIRANGSTIIPVYDLSYSDGTLYRLQDEGTYYGVDNDWGTQYNYVVSPVRSFVDSISIVAYPTILPADGRNTAEINCVVLDQFSNGAMGKPIIFTDNDNYGYVTINPKNTDNIFGTGQAITYYRAGVDVHTVTIQGTVTQYD